ncbi:MAG: tetraacyldisaccharide 4'-kinase, partial [Gemmatimonadaceae bacterium]
SQRLLPAGPWREPLSGIRRASIAIITRKTASDSQRDAVAAAIREAAPDTPQAVVRLLPSLLVSTADATTLPASHLDGKRVLAVAAIGYPAAFFEQLESLGAEVVRRSFPDHHAFIRADIDEMNLADGRSELVVCTLKDAVKLTAMWPADAPPLWYVSQSLEVESGEPAVDQLLKLLNRTLSDTWPSIASLRQVR